MNFKERVLYLVEDEKNLNAEQIYIAGKRGWANFDYKKGFDALIKKDKNGRWIYEAGACWKKFNFEKGLNALIKKDKTSEWISFAGKNWKSFDFEKGQRVLAQKSDKYRIYFAGRFWKKFDFVKGLNDLKDDPYYYDLAVRDWPKGIEVSQAISKKMKKNAKQMPKRKKYEL